MKKSIYPLFLWLCLAPVWLYSQKDISDEWDSGIIELEAFVVYEGLIDVIDGFTGEPYHENNAVVDGFREEFNNLLLAYHKKLVRDELYYLKKRVESGEAYITDLAAFAETFGVEGFSIDKDQFLSRDRAMLGRLIRDPFFKIETLVVWDLERLNGFKGSRPDSKYAADIQFNEANGRWERRVTTTWEVSFTQNREGGGTNQVRVLRHQGLNLETNKGFHFCPPGIPSRVPPYAFQDVILNYPIFINNNEPAATQIQRLQNEFIINLTHIYDPFSWAVRRNIRHRGGFQQQLRPLVEDARFKIIDDEWFDTVLTAFLCDVMTIKHYGAGEIYDFAMLQKIPVNKNRLGEGLDLLNWNEGENRSVPYNPESQYPAQVDFDNPRLARFILLDAYRRYEDRFVDILRQKLLGLDKKVSGKDLVKEALAEASGVPAEKYIKAASRIQVSELKKYRHEL
jgi:hypothetical protein